MSRYRAVFFDIDGTLVDSNEFHILAWDEAFRKNQRRVPRHLLREQIGQGADILIPALCPGITVAELRVLSDAHGEIFKSRFLRQVRPFPFAADLVQAFRRIGKQILLVSSSDREEVEHYARLLAIEGALKGSVSSDDVAKTKPAGDLFAVALSKAEVEAKDAIAVGDTPYDVKAAAKCNVRTIVLRSGGFTDDQLNAAGALAIATDVDTLFWELHSSGLEDNRGTL